MPGLHHVSVGTNELGRARRFYDAVLPQVGLRVLAADAESVDYGLEEICFSLETPVNRNAASPGNGMHVAFQASNREQVDRFYQAGLENGGADAGAPGLRPKYSPDYYGAFLLDPDGNKIEAVFWPHSQDGAF